MCQQDGGSLFVYKEGRGVSWRDIEWNSVCHEQYNPHIYIYRAVAGLGIPLVRSHSNSNNSPHATHHHTEGINKLYNVHCGIDFNRLERISRVCSGYANDVL